MEEFKLDLSKLTPVAEQDRVRGNWYVVADEMNQFGQIRQWHSDDHQIDYLCGSKSSPWSHWFAIPPGLPGFPKGELPDEIELKAGEWLDASCFTLMYSQKFKRKRTMPELTIPSGTKAEQIEFLRKELEKLETL